MAFGEDSWLVNNGGNDMLFNPIQLFIIRDLIMMLFWRKHYVYVFSDAACDPPQINQGNMPA